MGIATSGCEDTNQPGSPTYQPRIVVLSISHFLSLFSLSFFTFLFCSLLSLSFFSLFSLFFLYLFSFFLSFTSFSSSIFYLSFLLSLFLVLSLNFPYFSLFLWFVVCNWELGLCSSDQKNKIFSPGCRNGKMKVFASSIERGQSEYVTNEYWQKYQSNVVHFLAYLRDNKYN